MLPSRPLPPPPPPSNALYAPSATEARWQSLHNESQPYPAAPSSFYSSLASATAVLPPRSVSMLSHSSTPQLVPPHTCKNRRRRPQAVDCAQNLQPRFGRQQAAQSKLRGSWHRSSYIAGRQEVPA
ncbi:hypothetical protein MRB53_037635 [Persea americana]|nr:hypothetical protein MRB53_037635 [Persea americana]